jgi:hypothetical protein
MNVQVALARLRSAVTERGAGAYVLTVTGDGRPHSVHTDVRWDGDGLVADAGEQTAANAAARPQVSVLYPLRDPGDYSLIVDGTVVVESSERGHRLRVTPTRAVLHRNAPPPDPMSSCTADCVPILVTSALSFPRRSAPHTS